MSDTPRTDAEEREHGYTRTVSRDGIDYDTDMVPAAFARQLERDLNTFCRGFDILRAGNRDQRQGADSPTSATIDPSADQDHAPARNNAQSTVGALQEATETPRVQSAPATLPWCGCKGPWCEGRDRDSGVKCLGYQIDSDGMAGVGACVTCGDPQEATTLRCTFCGLEKHAANCIVRKVDALVAVCSDMNERVGRLERRAAYREALTEKLIDCALDSDAAGRPDGALANTALLLRQVIAQDHARPRYPDSQLQIILDENVRKPLEELFPELTGHPVEELIAHVKERLRCTGHPCYNRVPGATMCEVCGGDMAPEDIA